MAGWWPLGPGRADVDGARWVVLDVETSGLDPARDRLLAIAAVAVHVDWTSRRLSIRVADSFEVVLRQPQPSDRQNILLHGIGVARQAAGISADEAMRGFAQYAANAPLLAFHAPFDRTMVDRYAAAALGSAPRNPWLDIEHLCGAAHPEVRARSLDDWLDHFRIRCAARHQAAADVMAECELLLRVWPRVAAECRNWPDVQRMAARHRWLARR